MDGSSPARLYSLLVGAVLVIAGIVGFFYEASFDTGDSLQADKVFGILAVNGWHNVVHIVAGLIGLMAAGSASGARTYALVFGVIYLGLAVWGFADEVILEFLPVNDEDNVLHLALGILGIAAAFASPREAAPTAPAT